VWRPLSVDPESTWLAAAYLLAPAAMFLATLRLTLDERRRLFLVLVCGAALSAALGVFQVASGGMAFHLYKNSHNGFATGFFGNRNHQADMLLIGMLFGAALAARSRRLTPLLKSLLVFSLVIAFSAGVIATTSRMAFALLPIAAFGAFSFVIASDIWKRPVVAIPAAVAIGAAGLVIATTGAAGVVFERFRNFTDVRTQYWGETLYAVESFLPWGSGIGTFDVVYRTVENLNEVQSVYTNHAHNDYLQILLEAGVWGGLLLALFAGLLLRLSARRSGPAERFSRRAAILSILILLLHSGVDYPLRTLALLTTLGMLMAILHPPPIPDHSRAKSV